MEEKRHEEIPMVPKHQAQAEMMHMSWTIRWLVIGIVIGFLCMVGMAYIFVSSYNTRTEKWLKNYNELANRIITVSEVANEKEETGTVQQSPLP